MTGRLFVTYGNLAGLACDAWCIPTDQDGWITAGWVESVPGLEVLCRPDDHGRWFVKEDAFPEALRRGRSRAERMPSFDARRTSTPAAMAPPETWLLNSGYASETCSLDPAAWGEAASWFGGGLSEYIRDAAARFRDLGDWPTKQGFGRPRALVGVPVIGIGAGGGADFKGFQIREQVRTCSRLAEEHAVDVAIVVHGGSADSAKIFSAVQRARAVFAAPSRYAVSQAEEEALDGLAARAREGGLVLFVGAGVSRGAGLPLWGELLEKLAQKAGMSDELEELGRLDEQDRASVVERRLRKSSSEGIGAAVAELLGGTERVSLLHQLLASIPHSEAATTNYDNLFEEASRATPYGCDVLPGDSPSHGQRWLLKLHGSLEDGENIVLTRDDYMRYRDKRTALAGIVHALLITRHILFVGFGLDDPNFHQIVHDVRTATGEASERPGGMPFGTALLLEDRPFSHDLWEGDLELVSFGKRPSAERASYLEAFVDGLCARSQGSARYLLDDTFSTLVTDDEEPIREALLSLEDTARSWPSDLSLAKEVRDLLRGVGGGRQAT